MFDASWQHQHGKKVKLDRRLRSACICDELRGVQSCGRTFAHTFATTFCCQEWPVCPSSSAGAGARRHTPISRPQSHRPLAVCPVLFHSLIHREYAIRILHNLFLFIFCLLRRARSHKHTPILHMVPLTRERASRRSGGPHRKKRRAHVVNQPSALWARPSPDQKIDCSLWPAGARSRVLRDNGRPILSL